MSRVEIHGVERCGRRAVLPGGGTGALWRYALDGCVKSGTTVWCCEAVIETVIHCRRTGALRCIAEH